MRGHGRVPFWPIPRRGACAGEVEVETGVVATMRVIGGGDGIFSFGIGFFFLFFGCLFLIFWDWGCLCRGSLVSRGEGEVEVGLTVDPPL